MKQAYDTIIIGGGFYGLSIALYLRDVIGITDILVLEKESGMMSRASYVNQARVHNGYHYPRSLLTAHRSRVNFPRFAEDHPKAVKSDFSKYYAVARQFSKVNAGQFEGLARKIGARIDPAPKKIKEHFNNRLIEAVYEVQEYAFDSYKLRDELLEKISQDERIVIHTGEEALRVSEEKDLLELQTDKSRYTARKILNCTYSQINVLHRNSGIQPVALKHEITEMCLIRLPDSVGDFSVTVMDGPFFSIMPFPTTPYHSLSHVRYTPHTSWLDSDGRPEVSNPHEYFAKLELKSNFRQMIADVARYIPSLADSTYQRSIWEVKTVLVKSESDDSRPILFRSDFGLKGYTCIMGGKLDNIYDVFEGLTEIYAEN